jgi:hypothetical protein
MRPIFSSCSVNHSAPSGPAVMTNGLAVGTGNSEMDCASAWLVTAVVMRPILLPNCSANHSERLGSYCGRTRRSGVITEFPVPTANSYPTGITAGADGAIWFTENNANKIGRLVLPALQVSPTTNIVASGTKGGPFSPTSFQYQLTATVGSANYAISGIPIWLNANFTTGTATTSPVTVTFSLINVGNLAPGPYMATIAFTNTSYGLGNTTRTATLTVYAGTKDGCGNGGWQNYVSFPGPFENQGQCVSYFAKQ